MVGQQQVQLQQEEASPSRTTTWAGIALTAAAAMLLLDAAHLTLPLLETFEIPLSGWGLQLAGHLLLLAALLVLARGVHGEPGAAGTSRLGQVSLGLWGAIPLILTTIADSGALPTDPIPALPYLFITAQALTAVAAVTAAIVVARAGVLHGWTARALLPAAVLEAALTLVQLIPPIFQAIYLALEPAYLLQLALLLTTGISYLLDGRIPALRHQARLIRKAW